MNLADELAEALGVTEVRLPSEHIREYLRQEGRKLRPTSLRNWTFRGYITRTSDGYDLLEVVRHMDRRAGVTGCS